MKYLDITKLPSGRYVVSDDTNVAKGDSVSEALRNYADLLDTIKELVQYA